MRPPKITVLCALSFLVATGCTSVAGGTTQQTPTPTATVSATASLDATSTFNCRLPVISPYNPGVPPGGWITFPGGQFERDPASALAAERHCAEVVVGDIESHEDRRGVPKGFDVVLLGDVLEHLADPWATLSFARGLLAPGGVVVVWRHSGTTPGSGVPFEHRWAWVVQARGDKAVHIRAYFDPGEALRAAGSGGT